MDRACGIADRALEMRPDILYLRNGALHIPDIVQCIKYPENVHTAFPGKFYEFIDHIVRVMAVPDKVLATKQHLDRGPFQLGL